MAVVTPVKNTSSVFVRVIIFILILAVIIGLGVYLFRLLRPNKSNFSFPQNTFSSRVEPRTYIDKDGKKITYYVLNTQNQTREDYYSCKFVVVAKGTLTQYQGFLSDYQLKNCNAAGREVRPNYECRLDNGIKKYFKYEPAITLRKFPANSSHEIAVSRFYISQTLLSESFLTQNQLSDIFEYQISCNTEAGKTGLHIQTL